MGSEEHFRVAVVCTGDRRLRDTGLPADHRLMPVFHALREQGMIPEAAVYHDDFAGEVREQLMAVDAALVWMNPIQDGRDRSILDSILREVAARGVFVSTHPDVILKMGTKEVLYATRSVGWSGDVRLYRSLAEMEEVLPELLASGEVRVVKQYRGNGGMGVWKVELVDPAAGVGGHALVRVRQGRRGCFDEVISLADFFARCAPYFARDGRMIDQAYQHRLPEGMLRCYLVGDRVAGFGHQERVAMYPPPPGAPPEAAPDPGPRLYYPPDMELGQPLKERLENEWVAAMVKALDMRPGELPLLWDCDFFFGPRDGQGRDTYVLCEINVSSVAPFPPSAPPRIARALAEKLKIR